MSIHAQTLAFSLLVSTVLANGVHAAHSEDRSVTHAPRAVNGIRVDGMADEPDWNLAAWRDINHRWLGPEYTRDDFEGRFKLVWTPKRLYLLVEVTDDILFDSHRDPDRKSVV